MATSPNPLTDYWGVQATGNATTVNVWNNWNQQYYGTQTQVTAANYAQTIWVSWNQALTGGQLQGASIYQPPQISEADMRRMNEANERAAEEQKQRLAAVAAARAKAKKLLLEFLTREQRETFEKDNHFELMVNDRLYRIKPGQRVERLNAKTKKVESYFCIHAPHSYELPAEDVALGQKLFLEANETEFLKVANETRAA